MLARLGERVKPLDSRAAACYTRRVRPPFDLDSLADLLAIRRLARAVDALPPPAARWVRPPDTTPRWAALLAGSFNPPTRAHLAVLEAARAAGADLAAFVVAIRSVDKESVEAASLEDRLALLDAIAFRLGAALLLTNAGLYVDQARAIRELLPASRLSFVVGFDKLLQILDPRYYDDRDRALRELFARADLLVLPRAGAGEEAFRRALADPANQRWASAVTLLPAPATLDPDLSASAIRAGVYDDELERVLPPESAAFVRAWQPYRPSRYRERRAALDRAERDEGRQEKECCAP
jgi:nicotinamide-nucleotide adenylyltransferase